MAPNEKYPKTVSSTGARHIKQDSTDAPDTQVVSYEFESFTATWGHRLYAGNNAEKHNLGCYFYGTEGTLHIGWQDAWTFYPANKNEKIIHKEAQLGQPDGQNITELWANFLEAIELRTQPVCHIEIGHRSTNMSLLGMVSYKMGRSVKWDGKNEVIIDDSEANEPLMRKYRKPLIYPEL